MIKIKTNFIIKKGRRLSLLLLFLILAFEVNANTVDMRIAREVAVKFMNANTKMPIQVVEELQLVGTYNISCGDAAFYVFNTPNGFVIVSADDRATPILGYSEEGQFDIEDIPAQLQAYLHDFVEQIQFCIENHIEADSTRILQWEMVQTTGYLIEQRYAGVEPLLSDTWGQGCHYNNFCPIDSNGACGHVKVGCVATSMAQVLHYWGYPSIGMGSHTYKPTNYPTQTANFGTTTYDWAHMPNNLSNASTSTEINAVATLMWQCGVAVDMNYGPSVSGALFSKVVPSLLNYFGYSNDLSEVSRYNYNNAEWLNMMKSSLNLGCPVLYSGTGNNGGHAFVCDGYDSNNLFHFNWGWNGNHNGYFALGALNVVGNSYNSNNEAIINIHPNCTQGTTYQVTASKSPYNGGQVYGSGIFDCCDHCNVTAVPANGYIFNSWSENGVIVSTEPSYSFTVTNNRNLVANFVEEGSVCDIIFDLYDSYGDGWNGNYLVIDYGNGIAERMTLNYGLTDSYSRSIKTGNTISFSWISSSTSNGCSFDVRFGNGALIYHGENLSSSFHYDFTLDCESAYTPHFISAISDPVEGGVVYGSGTYESGTLITLSAVPNEGYNFLYWEEDGEIISSDADYSFLVLADRNLLARFTLLPIIYVTTNITEGGTVTGGGAFDFNNICTLSATANEGYVFDSWTKDGEVVSYLSNYVFTVTESAEYVANFSQVDGLVIGDATFINRFLPSYCGYHSLSEQIYTASEMGDMANEILSLSFFNTRYSQTCNMSIYMVHTDKTEFENTSDWIAVTEADLVYNGSFTMTSQGWTTIYFDTPFIYDGVSNVALIVDDNTNIGFSTIACRTFGTDANQVLRVLGFSTNINPQELYGYTGTLISEKNQIIFGVTSSTITQVNTFVQGWNWFSTYIDRDPVELLNMLKAGLGENGLQIKSVDDYTDYYDGFGWFGSLDELGIINTQMYMVLTNATCSVELQGPAVNFDEMVITIVPGWNWIGYPCTEEMEITDALASFEAEVGDRIECNFGGIAEYLGDGFWMGFMTFEPGQGYMYYSSSSETKSLVFQSRGSRFKRPAESLRDETFKRFDKQKTAKPRN